MSLPPDPMRDIQAMRSMLYGVRSQPCPESTAAAVVGILVVLLEARHFHEEVWRGGGMLRPWLVFLTALFGVGAMASEVGHHRCSPARGAVKLLLALLLAHLVVPLLFLEPQRWPPPPDEPSPPCDRA